MSQKLGTFAALFVLPLIAGLARAGATTLRPRPLAFASVRQVPLLADPQSVGELLPPQLPDDKADAAAQPLDDETVQALRESGLTPAQIREVAQNSKTWNERVAKRDGRAPATDDKDELAKKSKARRFKIPFGRR